MGTIILVIIAITVGVFVWKVENEKGEIQSLNINVKQKNFFENQENQNQQGRAAVNNELDKEEVSFCGKIYETETIVLDGVDVVKRIAALSQNNKLRICENIETNSPDKNLNSSLIKQSIEAVDYKEGIYFAQISVLGFKIDLNANSIYVLSAFDSEITFVGKLK